jgi:hypothetical protein
MCRVYKYHPFRLFYQHRAFAIATFDDALDPKMGGCEQAESMS